MKLQLLYQRSCIPSGADRVLHGATGAAQDAELRPVPRLFIKRASLAVAFVAATFLAACGGGGSPSVDSTEGGAARTADTAVILPDAPTATGVGISGTAKVGETLEGFYTYADANSDPQGTSTFRWLRSGVAIPGATAEKYTLVGADQGNPIIFEVTPVSTVAPERGLTVRSEETAPIPMVVVPITPAAPTASSVTIIGAAQVGGVLTGKYVYADANSDSEGASTFRWLRNDVAITGATRVSYTPVAADQRALLTFEVTPVASVAPFVGRVVSAATAAIAGPGPATAPTANPVTISGIPQVGQTLNGSYVYADANNDLEGASAFRWLSTGTPIPGATARTYQLTVADQGKTITFEVTPVSTVAPEIGAAVASSPTAAISAAPKSVAMKLLVISAEGTAPSYAATTSILDQIGIPYDRIVVKGSNATSTQIATGTLSDGLNTGKYQGIILETGDLAYQATPGFFPSAMTAAQWAMLRQYQVDFGVRSATMYTRPAATIDVAGLPLDLTYGLTAAELGTATDTVPLLTTFTPAGVQTFSYLKTTSSIAFKGGVFTYKATPTAGTTVSLLQAPDGKSLASVYTAPPVAPATTGWENLALASDNNPELTHTLLLGYGIVNWVTKGLFLGERKIYMSAQPDDVFIPDDIWDPATLSICGDPIPAVAPIKTRVKACEYRMTGTDFSKLATWQTAMQALPNASQIRLELPFNGFGYNLALANDSPDTLTAVVNTFKNVFRWINHTWNHENLDTSSASLVTSELTQNHNLAASLGFTGYYKDSFIQPDISGLVNPAFYTAARTFGLTNILMDTSKAYADFIPDRPVDGSGSIAPNTGYYSKLDLGNPKIIIIPRYPTSLYYNVSTPEEWLSEYNYFYAPGGLLPTWDHALVYSELLDKESEVLVRYMLKYNVNSWMFHQANLRFYPVDGSGNPAPYPYTGASPGSKSTLGDLLNAVVNKYNTMYNLPIQNLSQHDIAALIRARMAYNAAIAAGVTGRIVTDPLNPRKIEITNPTGAQVNLPVTGINVNGTQYGGQSISVVPVGSGVPTSYAAP